MIKAAFLGTTALVAFAMGGAFAAPSHPTATVQVHQPKAVHVLPHRNSTVLYDQSAGSNGLAIISQSFEPTFSVYDSNGADDFPKLHGATITEVVANGVYFNGSGPASSFDVIFYKQIKLKHGVAKKVKVQATCAAQGYTDLGVGYPDITLKGCKGSTTFHKGGWVAVIANLEFSAGGEWGWNTNAVINGSQSVYRTPNDPSGCPVYTYTSLCLGGDPVDFAFALLGN